jgi:hypothetical protein
MLTDHPLRLEVLVNSPGPHDQVRVREPIQGLARLGVDCRIHERPFRFASCIRPHSLVIWQRPLPEGRKRQWEHLQWLRERGCVLLTEWDDHPDLFPEQIRTRLKSMAFAPLELCHALQTSSTRLANTLRAIQPVIWVLENRVSQVPDLELGKQQSTRLRVLIANLNRGLEHQQIARQLTAWVEQCEHLTIVVIGDSKLASQLPPAQVEYHRMLEYENYRSVLRSCQLALLPLQYREANECKTPIKLLECAAESVATVCGPELYKRFGNDDVACLVKDLSEIIPKARELAEDQEKRILQVASAHAWVQKIWQAEQADLERLWLYRSIWKSRRALDAKLVERVNQDSTLPVMRREEFGCCTQ